LGIKPLRRVPHSFTTPKKKSKFGLMNPEGYDYQSYFGGIDATASTII